MVIRLAMLLCCVLPACAQQLEYATPERLSSAVNTTSEESMPLLSPDGKRLYFTRGLFSGNVGGKYSGHDIWTSEYTGAGWAKATNTRVALNDKGNNAVIGMNAEGTLLYTMNTSSARKIEGIYFTRKEGKDWSKPEVVPIPGIESASFVSFYVAADFDVIFISMKGTDTQGEEDIYVSLKGVDGQWATPRNIGTSVNTKGFEISPFLSKDKKKLYFSSNGHPGQGDADIFVSERLYESWEVWSPPQNLGPTINSPAFDGFFSTYGDTIAFLASNRGGKSSDIFSSRISRSTVVVKKEVVRQYLTDREVENLGIAQSALYFASEVSDLKDDQKLQLNRIARMLLANPDIRCALVAIKDQNATDLEIYEKRLLAILEQLKRSGVEGSRITFGIEKSDKSQVVDKDPVWVRFYR